MIEYIFGESSYSTLDFEKNRYYQCIRKEGNYNCIKMYYQDKYIDKAKIILINNNLPEFMDKLILKHKLTDNLIIKK